MLHARLSKDGLKVRCGMPHCDGVLATVYVRDCRILKRNYPNLIDVPDYVRTIFVRDGYVRSDDGSWKMGTYAGRRRDREQSIEHRREHQVATAFAAIMDGTGSPEDHERLRELLNERGEPGLPVSRSIDRCCTVTCPNPKCNRPIIVDPDVLFANLEP